MSILLVKTDLSFTFDNGVVDDVPDQILGSGKLSNEFPDLKNPYLESRIIKIGQETPEIWCFEIFLKKTKPPGTGGVPRVFWIFFGIFRMVYTYIFQIWKKFLWTSNFTFVHKDPSTDYIRWLSNAASSELKMATYVN